MQDLGQRPTPDAAFARKEMNTAHRGGARRSRAESTASLAPTVAVLSALAARLPAVHFLDLHDRLCEGAACGPFVPGGGGVVGWDDANHLSSEGQWSLWPELCEFFEARALVPSS